MLLFQALRHSLNLFEDHIKDLESKRKPFKDGINHLKDEIKSIEKQIDAIEARGEAPGEDIQESSKFDSNESSEDIVSKSEE
jgi:SMC interacting uncharacterized protein involved in chromosome segregation